MFNANQRPAVDVGISVSRVGGAAQIKAMKSVSGTLKISLAQYRDMEAFAMFASDLDETSRRQLDRGARLMELLKQGQFSPYPVEEQTISVWGGTTGKFDDVPVSDVLRFEGDVLEYLRSHGNVLTTIRETGKFDDDAQKEAAAAFDEVKKGFKTSDGKMLVGHEEFDPMSDEEIDQVKIVRAKKG